MDLLSRSLHEGRRTVRTVASVAGGAAVGVLSSLRLPGAKPETVKAAVTVNRTAQEAYALWRDLTQLPRFLFHVEEVTVTGPTTSHWRAAAPLGLSVEWDAEISEDVPGERLSWRSVPGAAVAHRGTVRFLPAPGGRGTEVHVGIAYDAPGGAFGRALAKATGREPAQQVKDDLRRFKQVLETGEVVRSDGTPQGHSTTSQQVQHPAQPHEEVRA